VGNGSSNPGGVTSGTVVFVDEYSTGGTPALVQSIAMPTADGAGTDGHTYYALVQNGQQSVTRQLSLAGDGPSVFLSGYDVALGGASDARTAPNRSIARINANGSVDMEQLTDAIPSGTVGQNGVFSPDGTQVYLAGTSTYGVRYLANFTPGASAAAI